MTNANDDLACYFDEAYFERGWERGTAYDNYKKNAAESQIFKNVAKAIADVFAPTKALEIGCATGAIVKCLHDRAVDAWGIDVSSWAVQNAMHPNVKLASADALPFSTGEFDLVYSSHALEHLPDAIHEAAFREIDRVCCDRAVQFHMLPIVGTYPYDYDHHLVIENLRKDPTHNLLKPAEWWHDQWRALGWEVLPASLLFEHDTDNVELSSGQFCLFRHGSPAERTIMERVNRWNARVYRSVYTEARQIIPPEPEVYRIGSSREWLAKRLGAASPPTWDDLKCCLATPVEIADCKITGTVQLESSTERMLRIALCSPSGGVLEKWLRLDPGTSVLNLDTNQFDVLNSADDQQVVQAVYFGGEISDFEVACCLAICPSGAAVVQLDW